MSLFLSHIAVSLTHAPAASSEGSAVALHGHAHGEQTEAFVSGHDATDHEHQLTALAVQAATDTLPASRHVPGFGSIDLEKFICDGPRKPPRIV